MVTNIKKERNPYRTEMDDNRSFQGFYHTPYILTYKSRNFLLKRNFDTSCLDLPRCVDKSTKFYLKSKYGL